MSAVERGTMSAGLIRNVVKAGLWLRYRIRVNGLEQVAARGRRGILFVPNHPALIDPPIVISQLHARFEPRALADKDNIDRPFIRWFTNRIRVLPILDLSKHGPGAKDQVAGIVDQCVQALREGDNLVLYPAGHIYRTRFENLRGNSAVESILRQAPQTRVVMVRTRGLWGSQFSFGQGEYPNLLRGLRKRLFMPLKSFIFFMPRREVTIDLVEPDDFPRSAGRNEINAYLERFYNEDAPPNLYVPYSIWEKGGPRVMPEPRGEGGAREPVEIPPATRQLVEGRLRELTGVTSISDGDRLAQDLGLDSLARAELLIWLGKEFGLHAGDVTSLQTVADVLLATRGEVASARASALKPVPHAWFRSRGANPVRVGAARTIAAAFLDQARRGPAQVIVADQPSGTRRYRDLITAVLALKPLVEKLPGKRLAIMAPASVAATVAYLVTLFSGKTPVMLNWTTGARNLSHALELTGAQRVLTVGPLVARVESQGVDLSPIRDKLVLLEQLGQQLTAAGKLSAALGARLSWRALEQAAISDEAAILLTSGSEALPKAVPLTHENILTNVRDVLKIVTLRENDRLIGFLPPFHSFGLTVTMVMPLVTGLPVVYHANPTEAWVLAQLISAYKATMVVGTPTFLSGIVRASAPGQLESLRLAVTGAEKCPPRTYEALAKACQKAVVLEGYGVTECAPIIAANTESDPREGTIGRPLPSVEVAVVDLERNQRVAPGGVGMLLVRGPSVFAGYLGDAPTPFVDFEGKSWYRTGDLVELGPDGVLTFRGRLKRFIKLGGEMISLPAIEAALAPHYTSDADEGPTIAVEATPSEEHPEVVLFTTRPIERQTANRQIREAQLSPLHNITRVVQVSEIPLLGTGKTDYRALRERLARETSG